MIYKDRQLNTWNIPHKLLEDTNSKKSNSNKQNTCVVFKMSFKRDSFSVLSCCNIQLFFKWCFGQITGTYVHDRHACCFLHHCGRMILDVSRLPGYPGSPPLFQRYPTTRRNPWYFWQHEFFRSLSTLDLQGEFQEILEFASGFGSVWFKYFFCGVYIYISRIEVLLLLFDVHIHSPYFSKYGSMIHAIYVYMFIYAPLHISTIVFRARSHSCSCGH